MIISTGHDGHGERKGALGGQQLQIKRKQPDVILPCCRCHRRSSALRRRDVHYSDVVLDERTVVGVASGSSTKYGYCECCCERLAWASRLVDGSDASGATVAAVQLLQGYC